MKDFVNAEEFKAEIENADKVQTAEKRLEQLHGDIEVLKGMDESVKNIQSYLSNFSKEISSLKSRIDGINTKVLPEEACERLGGKLSSVLNTFVAAVGNKIEEETGKLKSRINEIEGQTQELERKLESQERHVVVPDVWFYFMCVSFMIFITFLILISYANMETIHSKDLNFCIGTVWALLIIVCGVLIWFLVRRKKKHYY